MFALRIYSLIEQSTTIQNGTFEATANLTDQEVL